MIRRIVVIIIALAFAASSAGAQDTRRGKLTPIKTEKQKETVAYDTIAADTTMLRFAGFEKTLRSKNEAVIVTNLSDKAAAAVTFDINYMDMQGRQLHREVRTVSVDLPAGETRTVSFPSFDRQSVWYFFRSVPNTRLQGTPFQVEIAPLQLITKKID